MTEGVADSRTIAEKTELSGLPGAVVPDRIAGLLVWQEERFEFAVEHTSATISARYRSLFYSKLDPELSPPIQLADRIIAAANRLAELDLSEAPIEHQVLQVNLRYALGPYVIVDGEWCSWRQDDDLGVLVQREPWSLLGTGETVADAIDDFRREAEDLAVVMQHDVTADLSEEARRMRHSVMRYLPEDG